MVRPAWRRALRRVPVAASGGPVRMAALGWARAAATTGPVSRPWADRMRASSQSRPRRAKASAGEDTAGITAGVRPRARRARAVAEEPGAPRGGDDAEEAGVAGGQDGDRARVGADGVEGDLQAAERNAVGLGRERGGGQVAGGAGHGGRGGQGVGGRGRQRGAVDADHGDAGGQRRSSWWASWARRAWRAPASARRKP